MPESCSRGLVVCLSPAAPGGPSPAEEGSPSPPPSQASLGVAHDDVPTKKWAHYGLVYEHREATTCRSNRIGSVMFRVRALKEDILITKVNLI